MGHIRLLKDRSCFGEPVDVWSDGVRFYAKLLRVETDIRVAKVIAQDQQNIRPLGVIGRIYLWIERRQTAKGDGEPSRLIHTIVCYLRIGRTGSSRFDAVKVNRTRLVNLTSFQEIFPFLR